MKKRLTDLIQEIAECMRNGNTTPSGDPPEVYYQRIFADFEPLSRIENGWIELGGGAGRRGFGLSFFIIKKLLNKGRDPKEISEQTFKEISKNSFDYFEIFLVEGVSVDKRIDLEEGFYLLPSDSVPRSYHSDIMFGRSDKSTNFAFAKCALVRKRTVSPAIRPERKREAEPSSLGERENFVRLLRLAIGLATGGFVRINVMTQVVPEGTIFSEGSTTMGGVPDTSIWYDGRTMENASETLRLKELISRMDGVGAIQLALDRLIGSRRQERVEDRIIDLGMAAEIILMHQKSGRGDGRGEITSKISTRAAKLIGADFEERLAVSDCMRDLYSARSITVHSGVAPYKFHKRQEEWDDLVSRVLVTILERGAFPDWKRLTLS